MPNTLEEHILYTRNEFLTLPYYVKLFEVLQKLTIQSYADIGANTGEVCNIFFEKLTNLKQAFLFEVDETNFKFMQSNVKNQEKVKMYNSAIYYGINTPILLRSSNPGGHIVTHTENNNDKNSNIITNWVTLEGCGIPQVDLVKIDIEGGEYELIGKSQYIHNTKYIEIEFHFDPGFAILDWINQYIPNHRVLVMEDMQGRFLLEKI